MNLKPAGDVLQSAMESLNRYLTDRTPEIASSLASLFMLLVGDYVIGRLVIRRLRKHSLLVRAGLFLGYALFMLPFLIIAITAIFTTVVLEPFKDSLLPVVVVSFLLVGILLTIRYHMKWK